MHFPISRGLPCIFGLVSVRIGLQSLHVMPFFVIIYEFSASLFNLLSHLGKLTLVRVERNEDLSDNLCAKSAHNISEFWPWTVRRSWPGHWGSYTSVKVSMRLLEAICMARMKWMNEIRDLFWGQPFRALIGKKAGNPILKNFDRETRSWEWFLSLAVSIIFSILGVIVPNEASNPDIW